MEFWEGAILIVGGIWLVGRVHRQQVQRLPASAPVMSPSQRVPGPTSATNTDGSGFLVSGETLHTGTGGVSGSQSCPTCNAGLPVLAGVARPVAMPRYQRPASNVVLM
jgi:hypothetical protein